MSTPKEYYKKKYLIDRIIYLLILMTALILASIMLNFYVKTRSDAKTALSEAKNVQLAMNIISINEYSKDTDIYNAQVSSGVSSSYIKEIKSFAGVEGSIDITGFNSTKNSVTGFTYKSNNYIVEYIYNEETAVQSWTVDYCMNILNY